MTTHQEAATLTLGPTEYQWESVWPGYAGRGWQHSGIAALSDGSVVFAHPEGGSLVRVFQEGNNRNSHGTDGNARSCRECARRRRGRVGCRQRDTLLRKPPEYHEELFPAGWWPWALTEPYARNLIVRNTRLQGSGWRPTVAIDAATGNIWVGDGYGASLVHCFEPDGQLRLTLDGSETGTAFSSPHGIHLRRNGSTQELYVADRSNKRLVVFGLDGSFLRTVGEGKLTSPSSITDLNGMLLVTELAGALAVFDGDTFVGHAGTKPGGHEGRLAQRARCPRQRQRRTH